MYEVEQKFPIHEPASLVDALSFIGARPGKTVRQIDAYFAHPSRDFRASDEALRIRSVDQHNFVTYKGPKIDPNSKTRREIEIQIADHDTGRQQFAAILEALGFQTAVIVQKTRRYFTVLWDDYDIEIALDNVDQLGDFIELELAAGEADVERAQAAIQSLAIRLGLSNPERRGYADLIDDRQQS